MRNRWTVIPCAALISFAASALESVEQRPSMSVEATYTGESWSLPNDEMRSQFAYIDNLDVIATLDGEALFGIGGLQLFAHALYENGHALNDGIADTIQGISNIEAPRAFRMHEAWAQWQLGGAASLRAGLYDVNSEFDSIESAVLFMNPSHGMGPDFSQSGLNGPSIFPVTSVGARARVESSGWLAQLAVLDAVPGHPDRPERTGVHWESSEGLLYVGEVNYRAGGARFGAGYWRYSEAFETLTQAGAPIGLASNDGAYAFAETAALASSRGEVRAFMRVGQADADVNTISSYVGAGVTWAGFARSEDEIGFAVAHARVGDRWRVAQQADGIATEHAELICELTARMPVGKHVVVQPDVQYVQQPGALAGRRDFWALGLRLEIGFAVER